MLFAAMERKYREDDWGSPGLPPKDLPVVEDVEEKKSDILSNRYWTFEMFFCFGGFTCLKI